MSAAASAQVGAFLPVLGRELQAPLGMWGGSSHLGMGSGPPIHGGSHHVQVSPALQQASL